MPNVRPERQSLILQIAQARLHIARLTAENSKLRDRLVDAGFDAEEKKVPPDLLRRFVVLFDALKALRDNSKPNYEYRDLQEVKVIYSQVDEILAGRFKWEESVQSPELRLARERRIAGELML